MDEKKELEIVYRAETEDDINELCGALLKVEDITRMAEAVIQMHVPDDYYLFKNTFELIRLLIKPATTFLNTDALDLVKAYNKKPHPRGK